MNVELSDEQTVLDNNHDLWKRAILQITKDAGFNSGSISVAVIDDPTIHVLNRKHLEHDYPTDVLSFVFDREDDAVEGEVIVSYDTAIARSAEFAHTPERELFLYVVHGTLHLVGYNDKTPQDQQEMRSQEERYLKLFDFS